MAYVGAILLLAGGVAATGLREPDLVQRIQSDPRTRSFCIHCNQCMPTIYSGTHCVLDEPTAALGVVQTKSVLELIRRVRDRGLGVVFVSHSMPHVIAVADEVQVLRLGRRVATYKTKDTTMEELVGAMTGAVTQERQS